MNRKEFIQTCGLACLGSTVLASLLNACNASDHFARGTVAGNKITVSKSEFVKAEKDKIVERAYVLIRTDKFNFPICIYKLSEGHYSALLMECSHKGCELQPHGAYLLCPCHGSEFSNTGVVQNPPAEQNLHSFKTTADHENIYILL